MREQNMDKPQVLIFFPESLLGPVGGPAGYLYNLKRGLKDLQEKSELAADISFYEDAPKELRDTVKFKDKIPKRLRDFRRAANDIVYRWKAYPEDHKLYRYDVIHFHSTDAMYLSRKTLDKYKGKVILTSHSPCVFYKEKLSALNPFDYRVLKKWVEGIECADEYAFKRADYIIFPCVEAEEPYYHTWDKYAAMRDARKYRYVPTGIIQCTAKVPREEIRKKYGIPENAFVVSYVGRHNEIKGYGDLKQLGEMLLAEDRNIWFMIAGRQEPMRGIQNDHWIEIGWTDDPHSPIAASDVFVLPNHETYFDLILLEALSLGVPTVMTRTGGNRYFEQFHQAGLRLFSTLSEAKEEILNFKCMPADDFASARENLRKLSRQEFSASKFAEKYVGVISEIAASVRENR